MGRVAITPIPRPGSSRTSKGAGFRELKRGLNGVGEVKAGREAILDAILGVVRREIPRPEAKVVDV